jgi:hypothetical protein
MIQRDLFQLARRFLIFAAVAFWLGGFTFYASVVIHTGHRVFGSRVETGFLTQQVTQWLNLSGAVTLALLLVLGFSDWKQASSWTKAGLWITWMLMVAAQVGLYLLHPMLDRLLDIETHRISDRVQFYGLHRNYMNVATAQWAAGLLHLALLLVAWRRRDVGT